LAGPSLAFAPVRDVCKTTTPPASNMFLQHISKCLPTVVDLRRQPMLRGLLFQFMVPPNAQDCVLRPMVWCSLCHSPPTSMIPTKLIQRQRCGPIYAHHRTAEPLLAAQCSRIV
jgi:hypothetical protein